MVLKGLEEKETRMKLTVSRSQLNMLNCIETRFLLFLLVFAELLRPLTLLSCIFLNLKTIYTKFKDVYHHLRKYEYILVNNCITNRGDHYSAIEAEF